MSEKYIQIGQAAMRGPSGEFLPAVPLFTRATDEAKAAEMELTRDIGKIFADKFREYKRLEREAEKAENHESNL